MLKPLTVWIKPSTDETIVVMREGDDKWLAYGKGKLEVADTIVDGLTMAEIEEWLANNGYERHRRAGADQTVTTYPGENGTTEVEYPQ